MALYPTPVVVVGTVVNGRVNWTNIAHVGVVGVSNILISMHKTHFSNEGILANKTCSVNLIREEQIIEADYVGLNTGRKTDKSKVFKYFFGDIKTAPLIDDSPICMECEVIDNYETEHHNNFILRVVNTFANADVIEDKDVISYEKVRPVLFEMSALTYMNLGTSFAKCWSVGKKYNPE